MEDNKATAFEADATTKKPIDEQVQSLFSFIQQHEQQLDKVNQLNCHEILHRVEKNRLHTVTIINESQERVAPQDLLPNNHIPEELKKTLIVLIYLGEEIAQLKEFAEHKFYRALAIFGSLPVENFDNNPKDTDGKEDSGSSANSPGKYVPLVNTELIGVKEKMMGQFLPTLQELSNFIERCNLVVLNFVQQLSSLYHPMNSLHRALLEKTHLMSVMYSLADLLMIFITLDTIITQNDNLATSWSAYKSMVAFSRSDPDSFQTNTETIIQFEALLVSLDQKVMSGELFKNVIEQNYEEVKLNILDEADGVIDTATIVKVRDNDKFLDGELFGCLKLMIDNSLTIIGTNGELNEKHTLVGCLGMYALYRTLMPRKQQPDMKVHRMIWSIQKTLPLVVLSENVMFKIGEFLTKYVPIDAISAKKLDPLQPDLARQQHLEKFDATFDQKTQLLVSQCKAWMILAESRLQPSICNEGNVTQAVDMYGTILLKGLSLAKRVHYLTKSCLVMHSVLQIPLNKAILLDVTTLLEILKAMEYTFLRKNVIIAEFLVVLYRSIGGAMCSLLHPIQFKLEGMRNLDNNKAYVLASVKSLIHVLRTTEYYTPSRQITVSLLLEIIISTANASIRSDKDASRLQLLANKLIALSNFQKELSSAVTTSFMFFHTSILQPIITAVYSLPTEANRIPYIYSIFEDGGELCNHILYETEADRLKNYYENYRNFMKKILSEEIIQPLCRDIENDLRYHIHTKHLDHMVALNPKTENLKILKNFVDLLPIRILGILVSIKDEVTHYLDRNFYNLTTIALHDWRTYAEMRSLAAEKYGIYLMDNFLPMGSLDQGLDVLQIMRNIHIFVNRFNYNLNMQQFIEYRPDKASKHINTIKIQSIAASIRQHGLGVLNTTVNFTYQFLSTKFKIFSQFLFDEHIRAQLSKEHRWYRKNKNLKDINNMYPYENAMNIVKEIRKLGVTDQKTYLDQFRILVTEIGNALGYVRMVRSASMYYCSEAVKYLPEFEDIIEFEKFSSATGVTAEENHGKAVKGANLSPETVRAAKNLDEVIKTLVKNFGEGSDYFKVLVNVFQSVLSSAEQDHLKYFYIIVPSMCISWIEASLAAKDNMHKSGRGTITKEVYFTDDGFAMGVAYCLAILKQTKKFEALHWQDSMKKKIREDELEWEKQQKIRAEKESKKKEKEKGKRNSGFFGFGKKEEKEEEENYEEQDEIHTLQVTGKRIESTRRESQQLFYSMSGADIFFKRTDIETD